MSKPRSFPCTGCGACCRIAGAILKSKNDQPPEVQKAIDEFPYKTVDGVCEKLVDNKCSVYEDRPILCNIEETKKLFPSLTRDAFFKINADFCNELQKKFNLPKKYRVWYH